MDRALPVVLNLSIRGKMLIGFAAVIGLVALGNLYGVVSVGQIGDRSRFARDIAFRKVVHLTELENLVKQIVDSTATAVDVGIPEPLSHAAKLRTEVEAKIRSATTELGEDPDLSRATQDLLRDVDEHLRRGNELLQLALDRQGSAFGPPRKQLEDDRAKLLRTLAAVRGRSVQELDSSLQSIAQLTGRSASSVAGVTVLGLLAALLIAVRLSRHIVRPLQRLIAMMKEAQSGDVSVRALVERRDETGALSQGFNEMLGEIEGHRTRLEKLVEERTMLLESANQRLQTELEVRRITEAARAESEELLRNVLDAVHAGIMIVDAQRREILDVNPHALQLIGADRKDVVGRRSDSYLRFDEAVDDGDEGAVLNVKGLLQRADGGRVPILTSVASFRHQGRSHLIESFVDVSELRQ